MTIGVQIVHCSDQSFLVIMTKTAKISTRIEPEIKDKVDFILASIGISPSDAINMFYHQVVLHQGLPFEAKIPNKETLEAMRELKNKDSRKHLKSFSSVKELMEDLNS